MNIVAAQDNIERFNLVFMDIDFLHIVSYFEGLTVEQRQIFQNTTIERCGLLTFLAEYQNGSMGFVL